MQIFNEVTTILRRNHAIKDMTLVPSLVGVHPSNRSGKLLTSASMWSKGSKIVAVGFSNDICKGKAWAFQEHPTERHVKKSMGTLVGSAPDNFGSLSDSYMAGSVGCGHLNQFLLAVSEGKTCSEPSIADEKGRVDTAKLWRDDGALRLACEQGLRWHIIDYEVEVAYPRLPEIVQRCLNVEHNIGAGESFDEQLLSIAVVASELVRKGKLDWFEAQKQASASASNFIADMPAHINFCKKFGGGNKM